LKFGAIIPPNSPEPEFPIPSLADDEQGVPPAPHVQFVTFPWADPNELHWERKTTYSRTGLSSSLWYMRGEQVPLKQRSVFLNWKDVGVISGISHELVDITDWMKAQPRTFPTDGPEPPATVRYVTYVGADPEQLVFKRELEQSPSDWTVHGFSVDRGDLLLHRLRVFWPVIGFLTGRKTCLQDVTAYMEEGDRFHPAKRRVVTLEQAMIDEVFDEQFEREMRKPPRPLD
jgi:hypothetical protein